MPSDETGINGCLAVLIVFIGFSLVIYLAGWSLAWFFYFISWLFPMPL
jgi:hypothetical protein